MLRLRQISILTVVILPTFHGFSFANDADLSSISIPVRINLKTVEDRINAEIPQRLADINESGRVCVEAKWLKTKIPVGIEVYDVYKTRTKYKWLKTKVTPEIKCDVNGWVNRNGNIGITGEGATLRMSFPIASSVSAKAAGISETADAKATIFADVTPNILPDWTVSASVNPDMKWDQRPTLKLFGIINITIGSKVEPKLRDKMNEFAAQVPQMLSDLNLRSRIEEAWAKIQEPIEISKAPATYLVFRPSSVGFSGISVIDNILNAQVSIAGKTSAVVGNKPTTEAVPLQPLQRIEAASGVFKLNVPAFVAFKEIEKTANSEFPNGHSIKISEGKLDGELTIRNLQLSQSKEGKFQIKIGVDYDDRSKFIRLIDYFNWFDTSGIITFAAIPKIDAEKDVVYVDDLEFDSDTNNRLVDVLVDISKLPILRSFISNAVRYDYSGDLTEAIKSANEAINVQLKDGVKISGNLSAADIDNLVIRSDGIGMTAKAEGKVAVDVGL